MKHNHTNGSFSSSLGFILACVGSAVGLGNIWMFPYRLGQYGGAAFLLLYLGFVALFGYVGLSSEFGIGRMARTGTLGAYRLCWNTRGKEKLGGALGCDVYAANLFASLFAAAYAEVMARVRKCPAMPYLVIAILPLLPGAGVYYTMSLGLEGNRMDAVAKGLETVGIAGSLAVGILLVSTVFRLIYRHIQGARAEKS